MACRVHDCTGPDGRCHCGYKLTVPRFAVDVSIYDNDTKAHVVNECFMCDDIDVAIGAMEDAIAKVEGRS